MTSSFAISDLNCPAILSLQKEVASTTQLNRFTGTGDELIHACKEVASQSTSFSTAITELGCKIKELYDNYSGNINIQRLLNSGDSRPHTSDFLDPGARTTWFKPALIELFSIRNTLADIFAVYQNDNSWHKLDQSLQAHLRSSRLLIEAEDSLVVEYEPSEILHTLLEKGQLWCESQLQTISRAVKKKKSPYHSYRDHVDDLLVTDIVTKRLNQLKQADERQLRRWLDKWDGSFRCWPLDYFIILTRKNTPGGRYGFPTLSEEIGVSHIGGISPLPLFAKGDCDAIDSVTKDRLAKRMVKVIKKWDPDSVVASTIQNDRRITLRKKLPVLDLVVFQTLVETLRHADVSMNVNLQHPASKFVGHKLAGRTEFNFVVANGNRRVFIFVMFSDDTTHKHKEVSGRLRVARASGDITNEDKCFLLVDGNLLGDHTRKQRVSMLTAAGWNGVFYLDDLQPFIDATRQHCGIS